jgi:hypothetical protein
MLKYESLIYHILFLEYIVLISEDMLSTLHFLHFSTVYGSFVTAILFPEVLHSCI